MPDFRLTDETLNAIAKSCNELASADVAGWEQISDSGVIELCKGCPQLRDVCLNSCRGLSVKVNAAAMKVVSPETVTDGLIAALGRFFPNITNVDLRDCRSLTDMGVAALAKSCPQITTFALCGCTMLTDVAIMTLADICPELTTMDLTGLTGLSCKMTSTSMKVVQKSEVTDEAVISFVKFSPNLKTVNLQECKRLTDRGIQSLAKGCPNLTTLDVRFLQLSDMTIVILAKSCPKIENVDLMGVTGLSCLTRPTDIKVIRASEVTTEFVEALAKLFPKLTTVDLSNCKLLSDRAIETLASSCPKITTVKLHKCDHLGQKSYNALYHSCAGLRKMLYNSFDATVICRHNVLVSGLKKGPWRTLMGEYLLTDREPTVENDGRPIYQNLGARDENGNRCGQDWYLYYWAPDKRWCISEDPGQPSCCIRSLETIHSPTAAKAWRERSLTENEEAEVNVLDSRKWTSDAEFVPAAIHVGDSIGTHVEKAPTQRKKALNPGFGNSYGESVEGHAE